MKKYSAIFAAFVMLGCGDPVDPVPDSPDPGFVAISITSAGQGVGAIRFTLTGSGAVVDSVRATGLTLYSGNSTPSVHRGIVVGSIGDGEVVRFWVPDRNVLANYQATLDEAAAAGTYAQLAVDGITVTIEPVGS